MITLWLPALRQLRISAANMALPNRWSHLYYLEILAQGWLIRWRKLTTDPGYLWVDPNLPIDPLIYDRSV